MDRRTVAVLSLAFALALTGCSGLFGGTGQSPAPPGGQATSPTPASPTAGTPTPVGYPAGYSEAGVADAGAAIRGHTDALLARESFTVTYRATVEVPDRTTRVNVTHRVNATGRRALLTADVSGGGSTAEYHTNDTVYVRSDPPGSDGPSYSRRETGLNLTAVSGRELVAPVLADVAYGPAERVERNGTTLLRYEARNLTDPRGLLGERVAAENVTSFSATLWVDADGLVRRIEYEATVERADGTRRLGVVVRVHDLGSTAVERPDWVEQAA